MYSDLDSKKFDYIVIGTSLTESILSALLSKLNKKVLVLEKSKYYGGDCKNINFKEFEKYKENIKKEPYFKDSEIHNEKLNFKENEKLRDYNIDFNYKVLFSNSLSTKELSSTSAAHYLEFSTIKSYSIYINNSTKIEVPTSKSEIFLSDSLQLKEKQVLFNFLMSVNKIMPVEDDLNSIDDFRKNTEVEEDSIFYKEMRRGFENENENENDADIFIKKYFNYKTMCLLKYVLANKEIYESQGLESYTDNSFGSTISNSRFTMKDMISRITKYLRSVNVYSKNPFLYPIYGSSEFSQALSRLASINNAIYIVNETLSMVISKNQVSEGTSLSKYYIQVIDNERNEKFIVETDTVIINEDYITIDNKETKEEYLKLEGFENFFSFETAPKYIKFIWFFVFSYENGNITENEGPEYIKFPKESIFSKDKNCFPFETIHFYSNSNGSPINRSILKISFLIEYTKADDKIKNELKEKTYEISTRYIEEYIINKNKSNDHNANPNTNINTNQNNDYIRIDDCDSVIGRFGFSHVVYDLKYEFKDKKIINELIITKSNYSESDLDYYFIEAQKHLINLNYERIKEEFLLEEEKKEKKDDEKRSVINNDDELKDDLLDDLMKYVDINKDDL